MPVVHDPYYATFEVAVLLVVAILVNLVVAGACLLWRRVGFRPLPLWAIALALVVGAWAMFYLMGRST